jgi:hypothetical protein
LGTALNSSSAVVNLNGDWERLVHGKVVGTIGVPSSLPPSGVYTLRREFLLPKLPNRERLILRFNGINYHGAVSLNGQRLGTTIPYVPHEFDGSEQAREGRNTVEVEIIDAGIGPDDRGKNEVAFGTTGGWESSGGIIHDAYVEVRPASFISNVRFSYHLNDGHGSAACKAELFISSTESADADCELSITWGPSEVAHAKTHLQLQPGEKSAAELSFDLNDIALWSPDEPNLYRLKATLRTASGEHSWSCRTGFRDVRVQGRDFFLNGKRLVLQGVCRHDMWEGEGFTLTPGQEARDMRMIKALGCNFVRLVHYPHDRRVIELAEELGLFVSEEPGFWNFNFAKLHQPFIDVGLRILEAAIRRDWNSPAVMIWLLGNECEFSAEYLKQGKQLCNSLDPISRPVSVAHINAADVLSAKKLFDETGLDFYDWHAYEFADDKFIKLPEQFGPSKPLTLTEWGWEDGGHGDLFYEDHFDALLAQTKAGTIAGHSFWSWNDMRQYTREDWATRNGILLSGAVTEDRNIREPIYSRLAGLFASRPELPEYTAPNAPRVLPLRSLPLSPGSVCDIVDLQPLAESQSAKDSWAAFETWLKQFWSSAAMAEDQWSRIGEHFLLWKVPNVTIAGVPFRFPVLDNYVRPLVLTQEVPELTIPIDQQCSKIHFLGQVTFPLGYPLLGHRGEAVAVYSIVGANGASQDLPIRNGIETAQANRIYQATRVDPIATDAQAALDFDKDIVREQYRFLLWSVSVKLGRVRSVRCRLNSGQPSLVILAVTTEG